jgi:hypothetical protein
MAVNQAKIFEQLEQLTNELNREEFIYGFMTAYDFPKATTLSVQAKKTEGLSQSKTAEALSLGIATVKRHWNKTASIT